MKTRTTRNRLTTINNREELENTLGRYASAVFERDTIRAEMEARINAVRAEYEEENAELEGRLELLFADIENYMANNPNEIPAGRKSLELLHGIVGYRTGNPSVRLPRGVDETAVCRDLKESGLSAFVRVKEELNRDAVLAAGEDERNTLEAHGLKVAQVKDRFYIEVKRESVGE